MKHINTFEKVFIYDKEITLEYFFDMLSDLYVREIFCVKYYCQESTFSFDIYREEDAYHGKPIYQSKVYDFWRSKDIMEQILSDINMKILELQTQLNNN